MYSCPGCGSNLKFDIRSQQMACDSCLNFYDPYDITKESDAETREEYDVTVFTCPQCGGQIMSSDNSCADFCSFCGSSTILDARMTKEKRPRYIIPFKVTKEDCKQAYARSVKRMLFAPKELKSPKYIDGFRGIYTPYWAYHVVQEGHVDFKGSTSHRSGDYVITDHYKVEGDLDAAYKGLSYDASSSFDDEISDRIAPFNVKDMMDFTPSYLSGFYADVADVPSKTYSKDVEDIAVNQSFSFIKGMKGINTLHIDSSTSEVKNSFNTRIPKVDSTLYPVWFLSYRNKDRVAYATVNGQTGKISADMPISIGKYFLGSLLIALPIFFILNLLFTIKPTVLMPIVTVIALICDCLYMLEIRQISLRDTGVFDKGRMATDSNRGEQWLEYKSIQSKKAEAEKRKMLRGGSKASSSIPLIILLIYVIGAGVSYFATLASSVIESSIPMLIMGGIAIGFTIATHKHYMSLDKKHRIPGYWINLIGMMVAVLVSIFSPADDLYYYGTCFLMLVAILYCQIDTIRYYNILATRKLTQFTLHKGGDDRA